MKRLLSILFSVDERMVILDSYVSNSLSYFLAKRITGRVCNDRSSFFTVRMFLQHVESQKRVYSHVRNSSAVHKQENIVWTQVEKDINTGVLILRTVDLTVCIWRHPSHSTTRSAFSTQTWSQFYSMAPRHGG